MSVTVSVTAETHEEASKLLLEYFRPKDENLDMLLERVKKLLGEQGMTVSVTPAKSNGGAQSPAGAPEPATEEVDESVIAPKRQRGGQPKISKAAAAAALAEEDEEVKAALAAETPEARKNRCVAKLQELFAAGKKAEVRDILATHGDGAKSFHAVPVQNFEGISKALAELGA